MLLPVEPALLELRLDLGSVHSDKVSKAGPEARCSKFSRAVDRLAWNLEMFRNDILSVNT